METDNYLWVTLILKKTFKHDDSAESLSLFVLIYKWVYGRLFWMDIRDEDNLKNVSDRILLSYDLRTEEYRWETQLSIVFRNVIQKCLILTR